jgi:hypothetical protein
MTILHLSRASSTSGRGRATRTVKHDAAIAERDVDIVTDDEVVENLNIEEAARGDGFGREMQIVGTRRRVARGVVVDQDDAGGIQPDRIAKLAPVDIGQQRERTV